MIVSISAEAERDLEAIGDFIAKDNPKEPSASRWICAKNVSSSLIFQRAFR
jgi:plasmid stabilization system protein ParE